MNETQFKAKDLVTDKQAEVDQMVAMLKTSRRELRVAQRLLDKEILADPRAWVASDVGFVPVDGWPDKPTKDGVDHA